MKLSEVVAQFRDLGLSSRDQLNAWRLKKKWFDREPSAGQTEAEGFSAKHVHTLGQMLTYMREGLRAEDAYEKASRLPAWESPPFTDISDVGLAMLRQIRAGEASAALHRFMGVARAVLRSEYAALFLARDQESLELVAESCWTRLDREGIGFRLDLAEERTLPERTSWTCETFLAGRPHNLSGARAHSPLAKPRFEPPTLTHGITLPRRSFLGIPLRGQRGAIVGVLKFDNKFEDAKGDRRIFPSFTWEDEAKAILMSAFATWVLEVSNVVDGWWALLGASPGGSTESPPGTGVEVMVRRGLAAQLARQSIAMTAADNCEVSLWNHDRTQLAVVAAEPGENAANRELEKRILKEPSVCWTVSRTRKRRFIPDTEDQADPNTRDYRVCNPQTRSEIAIPLYFEEQMFGVLNAESNKPADEGGLQEGDLATLGRLASFAVTGLRPVFTRDAVFNLLWRSDDELREVATAMLERVFRAAGGCFDRAIFYLADYRTERLKAFYTNSLRGCAKFVEPGLFRAASSGHSGPYTFDFAEKSLATDVLLRRKPQHSKYPESDPRVSDGGLQEFGITGSMAGLPVMLEPRMDPSVVGVSIVWSSEGTVVEDDEDRLRRLAAECVVRLRPAAALT